jgi:hypothetical protein
MHYKLNIWVSCLLLLCLSGCVSKMEFDAVTNEYRLSQKQTTMNEEKIKKLEEQIQEIKIEKVILEDQLKTEKIKLEGQLNTLRKEIREKETVILIQGKVIKLLDDSDQTLQKSIVAQIEAQNITMDAFPPNP